MENPRDQFMRQRRQLWAEVFQSHLSVCTQGYGQPEAVSRSSDLADRALYAYDSRFPDQDRVLLPLRNAL